MTKNKKIQLVTIIISMLIIIVLAGYIFIKHHTNNSENLKIGFILTGSVTDEGWNKRNYEGISEAAEGLDAELIVKENIAEGTGNCHKATRELLGEGADMIFLTSYGYSAEVNDLIKDNPDIAFYCSSKEINEKNLTAYTGRMYQVRYLSGIIAGMQTKTNHIGYVAAMANDEVNRGINAFTLGVKSVNQNADVIVAWSGSWDNSEKETELANKLIENKNIDVITYHQNQPNVIEAAEKAGIYSIAYNEKPKNISEKCLTSIEWDFKNLYAGIIQQYKKGSFLEQEYLWLGIENNAVKLSELSEEVSADIAETVEKAKNDIFEGKEIFSGKIVDINGIERCRENEIISDEQLLENHDWYVKGVMFYED